MPYRAGHMDATRPATGITLWHHAFYQLLIDRGPPTIDIQLEVPLSLYPSRVDLLLIRRTGHPPRDHEAKTLRGLWPLLGERTLADFKSPGRAFRAGDLLRLLRYGLEYHELNVGELTRLDALTLVLIVPRSNKALRDELDLLQCTLRPDSAGYARLEGRLLYTTHIVFLEEVAAAERDEFLHVFTHKQAIRDTHIARWLEQWLVGKVTTMRDTEQLEGFDDVLAKLFASLPTEKRLAGLSVNERLAGLSTDELAEALSDEQLQALMTHLASKSQP